MKKVEINEEDFSSLVIMMISTTVQVLMSNPEILIAVKGDSKKLYDAAKEILVEIIPDAMGKYLADEDRYYKIANDKMQKEASDGIEKMIKKILEDD